MKSNVVKRFGKGALTAVLVASLSVMMTPVMAFADPNPDDFALPIVGDGGHAMEKRTGDIDTEKNGVLVEAKNNGIALGDLEGSVSASGTGVEVVAYDTSAASFETSGDVTSTGSQSYGAIVETQDGTQKALAQAEVGNVKAPSGFKVEADGGIATIVTEDVTATDADDENVESNLIRASGGGDFTLGTANAELGGVSSKSNGLNIRLDPLGAANVNTGKIEAGKDGINAENTFGVAILVASAVSSKNCGIYSQTHGADSTSMMCIDGNVESAGNSALVIRNDEGGKAMIIVANDAASAANSAGSGGLAFHGSDADARAIALVAGVLSGFNGIVLEDGYEKPQETLDLTVWKVEANGGSIIKNNIADADVDDFARSVSYIVKIEQPKAGGTVRATKADGSPLDKKFNDSTGLYGEMLDIYEKHVGESAAFADEVGFEVAHETDKVLLKVDLEKGYKVAHAYNGMGERVELLVDDKGDHYVMVERGGGIYLSVELALESYDIEFDLGGGTLDGKTGPIVQVWEYGSVISLPGAPTREGYRFLYWQGSHYDPGASYKVEGAHKFTAVWAKQENPTPPQPTPAPAGHMNPTLPAAGNASAAAGMTIPQTGDGLPIIPVVIVLLLAGATMTACGIKSLRQQ